MLHFVFCAIFLYYFTNHCNLRPAAYPHYYKEFLAGIISLAVIYLNFFLLFPKLYTCRKYKLFWLFTLCSIVMSGCMEMLLVYPEVKNMYLHTVDTSKITRYIIFDTFNITIRNVGWVLFSILINEIIQLRKQERDKANIIREKYGFLDVRNSDYSNGFINTGDIHYCEQNQNVVTIYAINREKYIRYCSMKRMEELLGPEEFVRISRNVIVSKKYIAKYGNGQLELKMINRSSRTITFSVGEQYENILTEQLKSAIYSKPSFNINEKAIKKSKKKNVFIPKTKTIQNEFEDNPKLLAVYLQIKKNPNCNVNDISAKCRLPKGTVRRYISSLMDKHLIQHTGSRRYGGYNVVCQDLSGTGNETLRNPSDSENPTVLPA